MEVIGVIVIVVALRVSWCPKLDDGTVSTAPVQAPLAVGATTAADPPRSPIGEAVSSDPASPACHHRTCRTPIPVIDLAHWGCIAAAALICAYLLLRGGSGAPSCLRLHVVVLRRGQVNQGQFREAVAVLHGRLHCRPRPARAVAHSAGVAVTLITSVSPALALPPADASQGNVAKAPVAYRDALLTIHARYDTIARPWLRVRGPSEDEGFVDTAGQLGLFPLSEFGIVIQPSGDAAPKYGHTAVGTVLTILVAGLAAHSATSEIQQVYRTFIADVSCSAAGSG